jgi:predicted MFS family arabinose efflux permease
LGARQMRPCHHGQQKAERGDVVGLHRPLAEPAGQACIDQLGLAAGADHDVLGVDSAVCEVRGVQLGEAIGDLDADRRGKARVERRASERRGQRASFDMLVREREIRTLVDDVEECGDGWVRDRRGFRGVGNEGGPLCRIGGDVRVHEPHHGGTAARRVARAERLAEAILAGSLEQTIRSGRFAHDAPIILFDLASSSLIARNRNFRLLWFGQLVSQLGDWFNMVAVYALLYDLTHSATAVGTMMVVQYLPVALVGPVAGVIVDRHDRRRIMIAADLVRGVAILALLFADTASTVWIAYVAIAVAVSATGFFEPARSSTIPMLVEKADIAKANALSTASWSAMLAIGASLGGIVTALVGRDAAFILNSMSFFISAALIAGIRMPARQASERHGGFHELVEGLSYMRSHPTVGSVALVKGGWSLAGGALLLLTVFGDRIFPIGGSAAAGIGVLYAARGVGAIGGALLVNQIVGRDPQRLRSAIGPAYFAAGTAYATLSIAPNIWFAALTVVTAHVFGSLLWVASSVLLQLSVPDRYRGRVFAAELLAVTSMQAAISFATAATMESLGIDPRVMALIIGALMCLPGVAWILFAPRVVPPSAASTA